MYRRIEILDGSQIRGILGLSPAEVCDAWFPYLRGMGTGKNDRYFFTEKGWNKIGRKVVTALKRHGLPFRIISVKENSVDVMATDHEYEVAVRPRKKRPKKTRKARHYT